MSGQARFLRLLLVCLLTAAFIMLIAFAAHAESSHQACSPPECYPTEEPPSGGGGEAGGWAGNADGRLNPAMDEYYSIYCKNDFIEVWGGVPSPQLIQSIPLADVIALDGAGSFDAGNGLTLTRIGDLVVIAGSNGNGGGPGSKQFSLTNCIAANGGVPPPPNNPPPADNPPPQDEIVVSPPGGEEAADDVAFCMSGAQSGADFVNCLKFFAPDNATSDYYYVIASAIATLCAGGLMPFSLIAAAPTIHWWRRRRKQQNKRD